MSILTILLLAVSQPAPELSAGFGKEAPVVCNPDYMKSIGCNAQARTRRIEVADKGLVPCNHDSLKGRACRTLQTVAQNDRRQ